MSHKNKKVLEKWYYDACTLEGEISYYKIINRKYPKEAIISHLSLGEAYGNCFSKGKDEASAFINLIEALRDYIKIVGNDSIDDILEKIKAQIPRLTMTDAIHLATALTNGCKIFVTTDSDFCGLKEEEKYRIKSEICKFGKVFVSGFSINDLRKKRQ